MEIFSASSERSNASFMFDKTEGLYTGSFLKTLSLRQLVSEYTPKKNKSDYMITILISLNSPSPLEVNNRNTRTKCEICSKLTIKTPEDTAVFIVNFEDISYFVLVFLLLTLNI